MKLRVLTHQAHVTIASENHCRPQLSWDLNHIIHFTLKVEPPSDFGIQTLLRSSVYRSVSVTCIAGKLPDFVCHCSESQCQCRRVRELRSPGS
jgi:hypothetical protein